jgi:hypothetical protein
MSSVQNRACVGEGFYCSKMRSPGWERGAFGWLPRNPRGGTVILYGWTVLLALHRRGITHRFEAREEPDRPDVKPDSCGARRAHLDARRTVQCGCGVEDRVVCGVW